MCCVLHHTKVSSYGSTAQAVRFRRFMAKVRARIKVSIKVSVAMRILYLFCPYRNQQAERVPAPVTQLNSTQPSENSIKFK